MVESSSSPLTTLAPDLPPRRAALSAPLAALLPVKPDGAERKAHEAEQAPSSAAE